jgi:hypothetical protein
MYSMMNTGTLQSYVHDSGLGLLPVFATFYYTLPPYLHRKLSLSNRFLLLIACICHDLDHRYA